MFSFDPNAYANATPSDAFTDEEATESETFVVPVGETEVDNERAEHEPCSLSDDDAESSTNAQAEVTPESWDWVAKDAQTSFLAPPSLFGGQNQAASFSGLMCNALVEVIEHATGDGAAVAFTTLVEHVTAMTQQTAEPAPAVNAAR